MDKALKERLKTVFSIKDYLVGSMNAVNFYINLAKENNIKITVLVDGIEYEKLEFKFKIQEEF